MKKNTKAKIKVTKMAIPPRDLTKESYDYACALVEEMNSNNKAFGEVLSGLCEKVDRIEAKGDATFEQVGILTLDVAELKSDVGVLKSNVGVLKSNVGVLKSNVGILKSDVGTLKSDVGDIKNTLISMNLRLDNIENEIASLKYELADIKSTLVLKVDIERVNRSERKLEYMENFLKANYANYQVAKV